MLKIATIEDKALVLEMAIKFIEQTEYKEHYTKEKLEALVTDFILDPTKLLLLYGEVGFIAGIIVPFIFGDKRLASELAWWVTPDQRGKEAGGELLLAFEYWAKNVAKCDLISMGSLDDRVGKYYEKNGYKLLERAYLKEL